MTALHCHRCGRFISPENCLEGWTGGYFGDYNGLYYCDTGRGCNKRDGAPLDVDAWFEVDHASGVRS